MNPILIEEGLSMRNKMKYFKELESEIRNYFCELLPPTIYYQGDTFEQYTEEDLDADIEALEAFIDYLTENERHGIE